MNWSKLLEVKEDRTATFIEWLNVTAQKYTNLDAENLEEAVQLITIFIGQSAPDIESQLQNMEKCDSGKLLDEAWKAYYNRHREKKMWQAASENKSQENLLGTLEGAKGPPNRQEKEEGEVEQEGDAGSHRFPDND